ncbi:MAG: pyridoxal phosphate-dependent aminotransferase [Planctomycetota bacterium]
MAPQPDQPDVRALLSDRIGLIDASGIRRVFDLAASLENPVDLSIGRPCHDVPDPVKASAIRAIRQGENAYTPTQGRADLVDALMERIGREVSTEGKAALVTCGVSGGLFLAFAALINPGDEVIMADPYFVIYKHVVRLLGGVPVPVDTYPDFALTADRIEPHLTPRTKLLIVASPSNPTGAVLREDHLKEIADLAGRHELLVLSDEIYRAFSYDGPAPGMAPFYEPTLLLSGFSKSHAATGWRVGYAFGPAELIGEMAKLQQYSFVCAPAPFQAAVLDTLDLDTAEVREAYRRKRDRVCDGLAGNYELTRPGGAFYVFPRVPHGTDVEFVEEAIRNNLLIIPGSVFSDRDTHFRISYAAADATLDRGVAILNDLA